MRRLSRIRPRTRRRLAWLALLLLAWQQLALAAYACAMPSAMPMPAATADRMAMGEACPSVRGEQAQLALCQAHCHPDRATQPEARSGTVPPSLLASLPVEWPTLPATAAATAHGPERLYRLRAPPPPASLLFCSLLI